MPVDYNGYTEGQPPDKIKWKYRRTQACLLL
jgi:hypothetical protein